MFDFEIKNILSSYNDFKGVYPRDRIPKISSYPSCIIINTDKSYEPGKHWVAMRFISSNVVEYFDSFGLPPLFPEMLSAINSRKLIWNGRCIQDPSSKRCGEFCVAFVKARSKNESYISFLKRFSPNTHSNDNIVLNIYKK